MFMNGYSRKNLMTNCAMFMNIHSDAIQNCTMSMIFSRFFNMSAALLVTMFMTSPSVIVNSETFFFFAMLMKLSCQSHICTLRIIAMGMRCLCNFAIRICAMLMPHMLLEDTFTNCTMLMRIFNSVTSGMPAVTMVNNRTQYNIARFTMLMRKG